MNGLDITHTYSFDCGVRRLQSTKVVFRLKRKPVVFLFLDKMHSHFIITTIKNKLIYIISNVPNNRIIQIIGEFNYNV